MIKFGQKQIFIPSILKISEGELENTGKYLKDELFNNAAVFFSEGIEGIFGEKLYSSLDSAGINVLHRNIVSDINIENIIYEAFAIPGAVDVLVGIGGGKALDYAKYCAHVLAIPFISIPTSTSNDGFCSPNSSLTVEGKRKTVKANIPYGVIVDIDAIKTSPQNCIYSGIGDLISKITAGWDWKEASRITGETFNDFAYIIANNTVFDLLRYKKCDIRHPDFLFHLANSLLMNGISMEIAGTSRPASGSEHLISHAYDAISKNPSLHGIQVGIAAYICSFLQQNNFETVRDFLQATGFFKFVAENPLNKEEFKQAIDLAPTIKQDFYTILSDKKSLEMAKEFINEDEICRQIIK